MKPLDLVIIAIIAILLFLAVRYAVRHRHENCDGSCSSCPYASKCHQTKKKGHKTLK